MEQEIQKINNDFKIKTGFINLENWTIILYEFNKSDVEKIDFGSNNPALAVSKNREKMIKKSLESKINLLFAKEKILDLRSRLGISENKLNKIKIELDNFFAKDTKLRGVFSECMIKGMHFTKEETINPSKNVKAFFKTHGQDWVFQQLINYKFNQLIYEFDNKMNDFESLPGSRNLKHYLFNRILETFKPIYKYNKKDIDIFTTLWYYNTILQYINSFSFFNHIKDFLTSHHNNSSKTLAQQIKDIEFFPLLKLEKLFQQFFIDEIRDIYFKTEEYLTKELNITKWTSDHLKALNSKDALTWERETDISNFDSNNFYVFDFKHYSKQTKTVWTSFLDALFEGIKMGLSDKVITQWNDITVDRKEYEEQKLKNEQEKLDNEIDWFLEYDYDIFADNFEISDILGYTDEEKN